MKVDYLVMSIIALLSFVLFILRRSQESLTIAGVHPFYYPAMSHPQLGYKEQGFRKKEYQHGYQNFGDKLWRCDDDPDSLNTVPCGVNDYSMWRECLLKKIAYNEKQCADNGTVVEPHDNLWYRRRLATNCAYRGPSSQVYTKDGKKCQASALRLPHGDCTPYIQTKVRFENSYA